MLNGAWGRGPPLATTSRAEAHGVTLGSIHVMMLGTNSIIVILLIGLIAGWLAGKIMGGGFGIIGDIIIGIVGAFIGTWLWGTLHMPTIGGFWISSIIISTVGACILLFLIRLVKRA
jgi:uncharacterized membrane protein YeaQ/YmgE (transglycosylase-associated protein family)